MGIASKEFGTVPMPEEIATPEDIASVVKGVDVLPEQSVPSDIVQLIGEQSGYQTGAFYRYDSTQQTWIKIERGVIELEIPVISGNLEPIDDHARLNLNHTEELLEVEDYLQILFQSSEGETLLAQFSTLEENPYSITLPESIEHYQEGVFIGRVCKNGYTTDFEINV